MDPVIRDHTIKVPMPAFNLQKEYTLFSDVKDLILKKDWDAIYNIVRSNPDLLHKKWSDNDQTILWMVICLDEIDDEIDLDPQRLQLAIDLIKLDPSVDLNVELYCRKLNRMVTILEGVLNYNQCENRDQLLDYLLLCSVKITAPCMVNEGVKESRGRIERCLSAGIEAMLLHHDKESLFFSLPQEIHFEIVANAMDLKYPNLSHDFLMKRLTEYLFQNQFEKVCLLIDKKEFKKAYEILNSSPSTLKWKKGHTFRKGIAFCPHFGSSVLDHLCGRSYKHKHHKEVVNFALRIIELDPLSCKEEIPKFFDDVFQDAKLLNYLLFCDVKLTKMIERYPNSFQNIKEAQESLARVISIGREALKKDNDSKKALEAMIAECPWIANFPERFVLGKLQEQVLSKTQMIKV